MRVAFDTSVLIAGFVQEHPAHTVVLPFMERVADRQVTGIISAHSLAELYAKLTRIPFSSGPIGQQTVQELIAANIMGIYECLSLSYQDYLGVINHLAAHKLVGGIIYDALIICAALNAHADHILTLNLRHFRTIIYPEITDKIIDPTGDIGV